MPKNDRERIIPLGDWDINRTSTVRLAMTRFVRHDIEVIAVPRDDTFIPYAGPKTGR